MLPLIVRVVQPRAHAVPEGRRMPHRTHDRVTLRFRATIVTLVYQVYCVPW